MSELLATAATALGIPDSQVQRSADARAAESGATVDEILSAWVGGAPSPVVDPEPVSSEEQDDVAASVAEEIVDQPSSAVATAEPVESWPLLFPSHRPSQRRPARAEAARGSRSTHCGNQVTATNTELAYKKVPKQKMLKSHTCA